MWITEWFCTAPGNSKLGSYCYNNEYKNPHFLICDTEGEAHNVAKPIWSFQEYYLKVTCGFTFL